LYRHEGIERVSYRQAYIRYRQMEKLATFRIDSELWTQFIEVAKSEGTNASKLLIGFIQSRIDGDIYNPAPVYTESDTDKLATHIDERIDEHIDKITKIEFDEYVLSANIRMENLEKSIESLNTKSVYTDSSIHSSIQVKSVYTESSIQAQTLEDTKKYLQQKADYNLSQSKQSDRINQTTQAEYLKTRNYPHPTGKKWNRDEVREICKMWDIKTK
jgi:hypothetical protein